MINGYKQHRTQSKIESSRRQYITILQLSRCFDALRSLPE